MLASPKRLMLGLALMAGCAGTVEGAATEHASDGHTGIQRQGDAGDDSPDRHRELDASTARGDAGDGVRENEDAPPAESNLPDLCEGSPETPLASGLRIREVALYQTVKVPLYKDGAWVTTRTVPVIQGKEALLRVFVDPLLRYVRRPVRAVLTLQDAAGSHVFEDRRTIALRSTDAELGSTFSFKVPGGNIADDTQLSIALHELSCDGTGGSPKEARYPEQGAQPLAVEPTGTLKVVLVPVSIGGRMPVVTPVELEKMSAYLLSYYPVAKVELSVRSRPVTWTAALRGTDSRSWSSLLNQIVAERRADAPSSDVYYFGLVQPADTFRAYCGSGCILGIAPQTTRQMTSMQVGLGASFADAQSYETMVHELGHAHGRGHAPCAVGGNIQGVDPVFPDRTGSTINWGWDSRTNRLMAPTSKDIMGYCQPNWISGYTYSALARRAVEVNSRALVVAPPTLTRWHQLILHADGSTNWGREVETQEPAGTIERATVRDAAGRTISEIEVSRIPLSDSGEAFIYVPEPGQGWSSIALSDRTLQLAQIGAAN